MNFRFGSYGVVKEKEHQMGGTEKGWKIYEETSTGLEPIMNLTNSEIKEVVLSAYFVRTYCMYKGFKLFVSQTSMLKEQKKVRLNLNNLDFAAYDYFGFPYRKDDASIVINENELEEIWEERERLARFPFKVEKIKYIKKEGDFL
ncbi:hypothetical protein [Pseudozobellia sp. WGM2]|uniref:hypothetical protein n=1 Tax=Pseudozobellia sp. WGM2 TaxID=2787625 RepID=UPI001AE01DA1|nr:hypothetical protein [Pseudozobellia sp. WGM2]